MSVQSELDRINEGKTAIVTSIENQGVAVPDGTTIDVLSTYVDAINNSNHNHEISQVNGLQSALDGKADQTELAGKAASSHTHNYAGSASAGGAADYALKMQTYYYNTSNSPLQTYGNQYPVFMQWNQKGNVGVWKVQNYKTAVNLLTTQDGTPLSIGSATQPVYFADGVPVATNNFVTTAQLEEVLGSYVNDIDALLGG